MTRKKPERGSATQPLTLLFAENLEGGKREANVANHQSTSKKLYVSLITSVYQTGNCMADSWYNEGTIILLSALAHSSGSKEFHFIRICLVVPELSIESNKQESRS